MDAITSALQNAMLSVQNDALSTIGTVLPYALAVMGAVIVISVGIRAFKKVIGR